MQPVLPGGCRSGAFDRYRGSFRTIRVAEGLFVAGNVRILTNTATRTGQRRPIERILPRSCAPAGQRTARPRKGARTASPWVQIACVLAEEHLLTLPGSGVTCAASKARWHPGSPNPLPLSLAGHPPCVILREGAAVVAEPRLRFLTQARRPGSCDCAQDDEGFAAQDGGSMRGCVLDPATARRMAKGRNPRSAAGLRPIDLGALEEADPFAPPDGRLGAEASPKVVPRAPTAR